MFWRDILVIDYIKSYLAYPVAAALLSLSVRLADSPTAIASAGPERGLIRGVPPLSKAPSGLPLPRPCGLCLFTFLAVEAKRFQSA
jgi:hypothetical protein